jgi:hypothetical protein
MRTTVELSEPIYRRLKQAAVERGVRGFSPIVEEALGEYFGSEPHRRRMIVALAAARGAWTDADVADFERDRQEAWATWRTSSSE